VPYLIKEISDMTGISIRMLRHYEKKGLLDPCIAEVNGYRNYSDKDLERLRRILFLRELDFSIEEARVILEGTEDDVVSALITQERLLGEKIARLNAIRQSINAEIKERVKGKNEMKKDGFKEFDMKEIEEHKRKFADEARKKYGGTSAYRQSNERTGKYGPDDWKRITDEAASIYRELAGMMNLQPDDPAVISVIGKWREHININFYDCTDEIFAGLAETYVADSRFTENIDAYGKGLASFMSRAMKASLVNK